MKKFIIVILIFHLFFINAMPVIGATIPTKIKIVKNNNKYGVIDKETKKLLIPYEYNEVKKLSDEAVKVKKNGKYGILYNDNEIAVPIEYDKVVAKKAKINNQGYTNYYGIETTKNLIFSKVGFKHESYIKENTDSYQQYPIKNVIIAAVDYNSEDTNKVGFIKELGNNSYITIPAKYDDYYFPDMQSILGQRTHASYFEDYIIAKKSGKWGVIDQTGKTIINFLYDKIITFDAIIQEEYTKDERRINSYNIKYSQISFPAADKFVAFKNNNFYIINNKGQILISGRKPNITYNENSKSLLHDIYEQNNKNSNIEFIDFPKTGVIMYKQGDKYGCIVVSENGTEKIPAKYKHLYFPDENSLIFNMLGISFAPPEQIWGMEFAKIATANNSKTMLYKTIKGESGNIGHSYKTYVDDSRIEKETIEKFNEYIKPPVTMDNEVIVLNGYVKVISKKVQPADINFKNYRKSTDIKSTQKVRIKDVAIKLTDSDDVVPIFKGYKEDTLLFKVGSAIGTILLIPFEIIAFPFVFLFFAIMSKS